MESRVAISHSTERLRVLTPSEVRAFSSGEVRTPETYDDLTGRPAKRGLYAEEIFGKLAGSARPEADSRDSRWGHLTLPLPLRHPGAPDGQLECVPVVPPGFRRFVPEAAEARRERARSLRAQLEASSGLCDPPEHILRELGLDDPEKIEAGLIERPLNTAYRGLINFGSSLVRLRKMKAPPAVLEQQEAALTSRLEEWFAAWKDWSVEVADQRAPALVLRAAALAEPGPGK